MRTTALIPIISPAFPPEVAASPAANTPATSVYKKVRSSLPVWPHTKSPFFGLFPLLPVYSLM